MATQEQPKLRAVILVVSDTAFSDTSSDKAGPVLQSVFAEAGGNQWDVVDTTIVPDKVLEIQTAIRKWSDWDDKVNLIVTSGGTGFGVNDRTPEAVSQLIQKHAPGLVHGMLAASVAVTPFAMMSRPVSGVRKQTLIITLPGSPKGAKENLEAVIKVLPHACIQAAGADSRALHAGGMKKLEQDAGISTNGTTKPVQAGSNHNHSHRHVHSHGNTGHIVPTPHTKPEDRPQSNDPSAGPSRRYRKSPYPMVSVDEASALVAGNTPAPVAQPSAMNDFVIGHVLAENVRAPESVPAFRASTVDGYAIRIPTSGTFEKGVYPVALVSHVHPSYIPELQEGTIARITTGAPLPPGADAVVMVEDTTLKSVTDDGKEEKEVEILASDVKPSENVREVGSDVERGDIVMRKGEGISATGGEYGLLASVGVRGVSIYKKPVVGVLSTGNEIVEHSLSRGLRLGEVRDTNRPALMIAIKGSGFRVVDLGIVSDQSGKLEEILRSAFRKVDVIITTGGVSMGELDLLKPTIERSLGGTIHFGRVSMKPGKPTTFATVPLKDDKGNRVTKLIFSLPGNPASAAVAYHMLVLPSLHQASGISPAGLLKVKVVLNEDLQMDPQRMVYHRVHVVVNQDGFLHASSTGSQQSSRIGSFKGANALLSLPAKNGVIEKGEMVDALMLGKLLGE